MDRTLALRLSAAELGVIERLVAARKMSPEAFARQVLGFAAEPQDGEPPLRVVPAEDR